LIIDESCFPKQGDRSVGMARHCCGCLDKVENCQVAVFAVLTDGGHHALVDMRLYLSERWIEDPKQCDLAEVPLPARRRRSKSQLGLETVRAAGAWGMRFAWVGADGRRWEPPNETQR
jgi:SRSO17 transposase